MNSISVHVTPFAPVLAVVGWASLAVLGCIAIVSGFRRG